MSFGIYLNRTFGEGNVASYIGEKLYYKYEKMNSSSVRTYSRVLGNINGFENFSTEMEELSDIMEMKEISLEYAQDFVSRFKKYGNEIVRLSKTQNPMTLDVLIEPGSSTAFESFYDEFLSIKIKK
jgi:hypothetical protein